MENEVVFPKGMEVNQGNGAYNFGFTVGKVSDIIKISDVKRLSETDDGIQRYLNDTRANAIKDFCYKKDAIFPTPIIVSLNSDFIQHSDNQLTIRFDSDLDSAKPFTVIDGQHRLEGISRYIREGGEKDFELPLIIYRDADQATAASIFVAINANQRQVDSSTISQLFGIIYSERSDIYTVESFTARVVKLLNENDVSPFHGKIKMLGKKERKDQFISQGTVAKKISQFITSNSTKDNLTIEKEGPNALKKNEKKVFRKAFIENQPAEVARNIISYFAAFEITYPEIWNSNGLLIKKSIGYNAMMYFLEKLLLREIKGAEEYLNLFEKDKENRIEKFKEIFSSDKGSSESVARAISKELIELFEIEKL
jgi:DGQHR domain protein